MRVLIVDDHRDHRILCTAVVANMGHDTHAVGTLAAALEAFGRATFDLVICDIVLPDGHGYDLMKHLAARYAVHGIALTGSGTHDDRLRSREAGFAHHLTKPFDIATLQAVITSLAP